MTAMAKLPMSKLTVTAALHSSLERSCLRIKADRTCTTEQLCAVAGKTGNLHGIEGNNCLREMHCLLSCLRLLQH